MEVALVYDGEVDSAPGKFLGGVEAAETATYDYYMLHA